MHALKGLLILLLLPLGVWGQQNTVSLVLLDAANKTPVENAFVFIKNSSIGEVSNAAGKVQLNLAKFRVPEIVITHLNYTTQTLYTSQLSFGLDTILLESKTQNLDLVTVNTKKGRGRKRKQWMRQFELAFFGETSRKERVKLLNPEVLWFEEKDSLLIAHAMDYLQLENPGTAYRSRFYLEKFELNKNEDVYFAGHSFFEDQIAQVKKQNKIRKKRDEYYLASAQLFFQSFVDQLPINEQQFEFGSTSYSKEKAQFAYQQMDYDDLNWSRGLLADTLYFSDYFTIINKRSTIISYGKSRDKDAVQPATSFLLSKTGRFIIGSNGQLINKNEIEESGYWTNYRIATMLPIDYQSSVTLGARGLYRNPILDQLQTYRTTNTPEKVYLHLNKGFYTNRENMWFKAYLVNGVNHRPVTSSDIVYVELIDPNNEKIKTWRLHRKLGLHGDFQWTRNNDEGTYRLRAYTNYMRNQGEEYFYEEAFQVLNFLPENEVTATDSENVQNTGKKAPSYRIEFFPEGGDLVANLPSTVCFSVRDSFGRGQDASGQLLDETGAFLSAIKTSHDGLGVFKFTPKKGKQYFVKVQVGPQQVEASLPEMQKQGFSLHCNTTLTEDLYINIYASDTSALKKAYLVGHLRGNVIYYLDQIPTDKPIKIKKADVPNGLLHFTIFDKGNRPRAERLVFNDHGLSQALCDYEEKEVLINTERKTEVSIQLDSSLLGEQFDASLSITNQALSPYPSGSYDIQSYLLLNSDLEHPIPEPRQYFQSWNNTNRFYLDLQLLQRSWRRFNWKDMLEGEQLSMDYKAEKGFTIAGYTTRKDKEERVRTEVLLNSFQGDLVYKQIQTDEDGYFSFEQLPMMDSTHFVLQGRIPPKGKKLKEGKVEGNRLVDFHLALYPETEIPALELQEPSTLLPIFEPEQEQDLAEKSFSDDQTVTSTWQIDLDEVIVKANRAFTSNRPMRGVKFYNLDNIDWIPAEAQGTNLLARVAPQFNFYPGPEGKLVSRFLDFQGLPVVVPVVIEIDGMGAEPGGSNAGPFLSLTADDIRTIVVTKGYIGITTRGISRTREAYLESGILQFKHPAYDQARTFFTPKYTSDTGRDLRTAIHWEPQLKFDTNGQAKVQFSGPVLLQDLMIKIEGITSSGTIIYKEGLLPKPSNLQTKK